MKSNIILWSVIAIIVTAVYALATHLSFSNGFGYGIGLLMVPLIITLIIPAIISLMISGIYYLIRRKKPWHSIFPRTMWITQVITIGYVVIGIMGSSMMTAKANSEQLPTRDNKISNEYIEVTVPENWEIVHQELIDNQLYNILCYTEEAGVNFSAILNVEGVFPRRYYEFYKETLFSGLRNNLTYFSIDEETNLNFSGFNAYRVKYTGLLQGEARYGEMIFISKNQQMVMISSMASTLSMLDSLNGIYISLIIK